MNKLKLGLIVNPLAGLGGSVALKGSDGADIVAEAKRRGAKSQAVARAARALAFLQGLPLSIVCCAGDMGEASVRLANLSCPLQLVGGSSNAETSATDTREAVQLMMQEGIDLLVFAGGDGTARDVAACLTDDCPVLGIPAGCKMHSGVYANNPEDAGELLKQLVSGGLVELVEAEVRDIDEQAFRQGRVKTQYYSSVTVPRSEGLLQQVKSGSGGDQQEALAITDMAAFIVDNMDADADYLVGSGTTVAEVMELLMLDNTLLGVDLVRDGELVQQDLGAADILRITGERPLHAIVTIIGGQGHLFGRGNQQFSPQVIRRIGKKNLHIVATKEKLASLAGQPLRLDSGDATLDQELSGWVGVITGYDQQMLYPLGKS